MVEEQEKTDKMKKTKQTVALETLPAVATKFYNSCKKCKVDRYHNVLVHPTSSSAKLECEVCKDEEYL